jgi:flavin reductase (DIM6/NTAB) family NADH-FMN oxidoreductase RutF
MRVFLFILRGMEYNKVSSICEEELFAMLHPVELETISSQVISAFGKTNALLTAGTRETCNTMTIGWCGLGRVWNLPTCTVYVRPERYTYQFMEESEYFTVCGFSAENREKLALCGTKSGRDTDKFAACGFTVQYGAGDAPFIAEAEWVLVCRKLYAQDMTGDCLIDPRPGKFYHGEGWHKMYIGEVVEAYAR